MPRKSAYKELLRMALDLGAHRGFDHVLYIGDRPLPTDLVGERSALRKKIVQGVSNESLRKVVGDRAVLVPAYDLDRAEKFKIAIVGGVAARIFQNGDVVLGMVGRSPTDPIDTILTTTIGGKGGDGPFAAISETPVDAAVLEAVVDLAVAIAIEGWEGHPIGTILVVGDAAAVMEKSRPLTLNPFQGYSEAEKNLLHPDVRQVVKNYAMLDGAFVIREDGVVLAAARYLTFDEGDVTVPLGLGARHVAAAGISRDTGALAVAISQTSGKVRMFLKGRIVAEIEPKPRRQ